MNPKMDVSVVICVLDGMPYLEQQLVALTAQETSAAWEIVVSDNGSSDGTQEFVRTFAETCSVPVRLINASATKGPGPARNAGAIASRGAIIAFCDADDEVAPGWITAAQEALEDADLVGGANHAMGDPDEKILNPGFTFQSPFGPVVLTGNCAVRREMFFRAGGFDEALPPYGMEDSEFAWRVNLAGGRVTGAPKMRLAFRPTNSKRSVIRKVFLSGQAEYQVWRQYPDVFGDNVRVTRLVGDLILLVPQAFIARRQSSLSLEQIARQAVTRVAHAWAALKLVSSGRREYPKKLLSPRDDSLADESLQP